jgi:S-(hydroxymethyl)glutathione dehydrogenase / alcohol dehydrogenase
MTKTRSAVLWNIGTPWQVEEVDLDRPRSTDVLVQIKAAGLCHSDEHAYTGDVVLPLPLIGGHEGAGIVEAVGPDVKGLTSGDHVAMSFIPACGRCQWCVIGQQYLCDLGAKLFDQGIMSDGRDAHHIVTDNARTPARRFAQLGTFSEYALVSENSLVKVEHDLPFEVVALVSCGVTTGFGSVTERAGCKLGDTVAVVGVGGIGMNAIQGARVAGA